MPLFNPPTQSSNTWTVTNLTALRAYDQTTATTANDRAVIATIINDLKATTPTPVFK